MSEKYKFHNPEALYFTTTTIINWIDLFTRKDYADIVISSLKHCHLKKGLVIHAWTLMPSHLHLIISCKGNLKLHEILRDFKKFTAVKILKCINEVNESRKEWVLKQLAESAAPLSRITHYKVWQDGNHPRELATNKMLLERLHYIHNNSVEAGLVWAPHHYCYSSAIDYSGEKGYLDLELVE